MPEPEYARSTRWLTCLTIDPKQAGVNRDVIIDRLENENIESRPTWKPMHLQPVFRDCKVVGGSVSEELFEYGLCLPSGTAMTEDDLDRIIRLVKTCIRQ